MLVAARLHYRASRFWVTRHSSMCRLCFWLYSERMNLAQLPIAVGVRNVPLAVSRTGGPHAPLHLHSRRPRRDPPRALPPPPPPRAAEDGGPVAEEPGLHPRGHGTPPTPLAL